MRKFFTHHTKSEEHYVSILKRLIPNLDCTDMQKIHGYNSVVLIVNKKRLFKFPQRKEVFEQYELENNILSFLKDRFTFKIPEIIGMHGAFGVVDNFALEYSIMPGNHLTLELENGNYTATELLNIGRNLADWLKQIHAVPTSELIQRGIEPYNKNKWQEQYQFVQENCFKFWNNDQINWVQQLYENFLSTWDRETFIPSFIHGDAGSWHVFSKGEDLEGMIDWGEMRIDDPACDITWHESENEVDRTIGEEILRHYDKDETFFQRTSFYKRRAPISKFIKGVQQSDDQRIKDGYIMLDHAMKMNNSSPNSNITGSATA